MTPQEHIEAERMEREELDSLVGVLGTWHAQELAAVDALDMLFRVRDKENSQW